MNVAIIVPYADKARYQAAYVLRGRGYVFWATGSRAMRMVGVSNA